MIQFINIYVYLLLLATLHPSQGGDPAIGIYELKRGDFSLKLTNYGAVVMSVVVPDKNGIPGDIALGFDSVEQYAHDGTYFGAIVGRVANRIGGAQFRLGRTVYRLPANDGNNTLHGGPRGYADVIWTVKRYVPESHITFTYMSSDGDEGFPGSLSLSVTYIIVGTNKLAIRMTAEPLNKATPVNLAFHGYWNLKGHASGSILGHKIQIMGSQITPVDGELIPTGTIMNASGTAYDFTVPRGIGSRIGELANGYDVNYVVEEVTGGHLRKVAVVWERTFGRKMELWSNQPGVQFYTSNMLHDVKGKNGTVYGKFGGFCLETQGFPDSVNHANFPSQIHHHGEVYKHFMVFRFTAH